MKSTLKKLAAIGLSALVMASTAVPAFADEIPEPDENGVYGQAGVAWMIMDWWDYRRGTAEPAMDEFGTSEVSSTYHDVNITGNGSYTVDMSGYNVGDVSGGNYTCGYLGLYLELDLIPAPEKEGDPEPTVIVTLDDVTIDGVTYTFLEQPQPEDPDSQPIGKMLKIKNGYGENAVTDPPMDASAWTTNDPITINFTISGLPTDKIEGYADETVEKISGNGSIENDVDDTAEGEESTTESTAAETEEETAPEAVEANDSRKAEKKASKKSDGLGVGAIVGIIAAAVVVIGGVVFFIFKKK